MFLGRILRLPAALLNAAYHLATLFALGLLGVQIVHQPTVHLARRLDFAQEKVHTIVLNLVIGPCVESLVGMAHFHVEHMVIRDVGGIRVFHGTMVERVGGIHIAEMLTRGIAQVGPGEVVFQPCHHPIDVFLFREVKPAEPGEVGLHLLQSVDGRVDASLTHSFKPVEQRVGPMVNAVTVNPEEETLPTVVITDFLISNEPPRIGLQYL